MAASGSRFILLCPAVEWIGILAQDAEIAFATSHFRGIVEGVVLAGGEMAHMGLVPVSLIQGSGIGTGTKPSAKFRGREAIGLA